ncbi:MAG: FkbM family methyltransferase [Vicinamibacterales bacterium]
MSPVEHVGRADRFRGDGAIERVVRRVPPWIKPALRRVYETALESMPGDRLVAALPGGERIRLSARHRDMGWNPEEYAAFRAAVRPGDIVLDIGANVGAYTILFAHWVGSAGRVFAFEPAPDARHALERHVRLNRFDDRVEVVPMAVSNADGAAAFTVDPHGGASALKGAVGTGETIDVPTTTIDSFCARQGIQPRVIKIDVEGAELDALVGARRVLAAEPVALFVEFHPTLWPARGIGRPTLEVELALQHLTAHPLDPALDVWSTEGICARIESP